MVSEWQVEVHTWLEASKGADSDRSDGVPSELSVSCWEDRASVRHRPPWGTE